jgi:hypothetical protein
MTFWVAGAALAGGLIASRGQSSAASTQADAAREGAAVQAQSNKEALALQRQMYDEQKALQEPYRQAGLTAQNALMQKLGLGGDKTAADYGAANKQFSMAGFDPNSLMKNFSASDFQQDPGYAFRLSEGLKTLQSNARARGGAVSGATMKGAVNYAGDAASQEYQNAFNRYQAGRATQGQEYGNAFNRFQTNRTNMLQPLGNLMASGQNAASNQGAAAGSYGSSGANLMTGAGQAMAGGITGAGQATAAGQLGFGNTISNALNTGASAYQNQQNFNQYLASRQPSYGYMPSNYDTTVPMQPGGGY